MQWTYTATLPNGIYRSQTKKRIIRAMEITSGASTSAEAHPDSEPLVIAKINRIKDTRTYIISTRVQSGEETT